MLMSTSLRCRCQNVRCSRHIAAVSGRVINWQVAAAGARHQLIELSHSTAAIWAIIASRQVTLFER